MRRGVPYAFTLLITMVLGALAYAYLEYAGRQAVNGVPDFMRTGLVALALLAAMVLLPSLIRRWRRPRTLTPHELHQLLSQETAPTILDVRSSEEFAGELGHINEAILIPLPDLQQRLGELAPHRRRLLVTV